MTKLLGSLGVSTLMFTISAMLVACATPWQIKERQAAKRERAMRYEILYKAKFQNDVCAAAITAKQDAVDPSNEFRDRARSYFIEANRQCKNAKREFAAVQLADSERRQAAAFNEARLYRQQLERSVSVMPSCQAETWLKAQTSSYDDKRVILEEYLLDVGSDCLVERRHDAKAKQRILAIQREQAQLSGDPKATVFTNCGPQEFRDETCVHELERIEPDWLKYKEAIAKVDVLTDRYEQEGEVQLQGCVTMNPNDYEEYERQAKCFALYHGRTYSKAIDEVLLPLDPTQRTEILQRVSDRHQEAETHKPTNAVEVERLLMVKLNPLRAKYGARNSLCNLLDSRDQIQSLLDRERRVGRRSGFVNKETMHSYGTILEYQADSIREAHQEFRRLWSRRLNRKKDCR